MKNFIQNGRVIDVVLTNGLAAGSPVFLGSGASSTPGSCLVGISSNPGDGVTPIAVSLCGVYSLPKHNVGETYGQGDLLYWDATNSRVTNSTNSGANKFIGYAWTAQAATDATCEVRLANGE